jgi:hypothetical protein
MAPGCPGAPPRMGDALILLDGRYQFSEAVCIMTEINEV